MCMRCRGAEQIVRGDQNRRTSSNDSHRGGGITAGGRAIVGELMSEGLGDHVLMLRLYQVRYPLPILFPLPALLPIPLLFFRALRSCSLLASYSLGTSFPIVAFPVSGKSCIFCCFVLGQKAYPTHLGCLSAACHLFVSRQAASSSKSSVIATLGAAIGRVMEWR